MTTGRLATAVAAGVLALTAAATSAPLRESGAVYRLRADRRMCPSPLCGGFFVSRVNQVATRCADGTSRPACYVTAFDASTVLSTETWARLQPLLASDRVLVEGRLVVVANPAFPSLAQLVASTVWRAPAGGPESGTVWLVTDTGLRCITNPCFSLRAVVVNTSRRTVLSTLALGASGASLALIRMAQRALSTGGVLVAGSIRAVPHAGPAGTGRTLVASRLWLRVTPSG